MIDSSICVCVITARLIGREEHWDIVITDTPVQPLTHADGGRDSPLQRGRDGGMEEKSLLSECVHLRLYGKGVKGDGRKAARRRSVKAFVMVF